MNEQSEAKQQNMNNWCRYIKMNGAKIEAPLYPADELYGIVSENLMKTYDVREASR